MKYTILISKYSIKVVSLFCYTMYEKSNSKIYFLFFGQSTLALCPFIGWPQWMHFGATRLLGCCTVGWVTSAVKKWTDVQVNLRYSHKNNILQKKFETTVINFVCSLVSFTLVSLSSCFGVAQWLRALPKPWSCRSSKRLSVSFGLENLKRDSVSRSRPLCNVENKPQSPHW